MEREPSFRDYLTILSKRRRWVVITVLFCTGAAAAVTFRAQPIYEAEAKLFVGQRQIRVADVEEARSLSELSVRLLQSYAAVLETHPITRVAVSNDGLPQDPAELAEELEADPILDTQLIRLRYRSTDPLLAQRTVNSVARAFVTEIQKIDAPHGASVRDDEPAVNVSVVAPALLPKEPVSPNPTLNLSLAFVMGALLGVGLALLTEYLDTSVKDKEDAEQAVDAPVLVSIPKIRTRVEEVYVEGDNQSIIAETYRKLRTAVQLHGVDVPGQVVLVTSPYARDGKTTVATNLAAAYAYGGARTVLLEADMRRPQLHSLFCSNGEPGLAHLLLEQIALTEAIVETDIPNLHCLPAAAIPANPVELLSSTQMANVMTKLRRQFTSIVIDAPPILPVADTVNLVAQTDGVILVALTKETRRERLAEAGEQVRKGGGRLLGVVLNAVPSDRSGNNYYSYYAAERRGRR
jgi:receptor protein-tyrosine kinase